MIALLLVSRPLSQDRPSNTPVMKRGVDLEPTALMQYSEDTGNLVFPCGKSSCSTSWHFTRQDHHREGGEYKLWTFVDQVPIKRQLQ